MEYKLKYCYNCRLAKNLCLIVKNYQNIIPLCPCRLCLVKAMCQELCRKRVQFYVDRVSKQKGAIDETTM
jgi:hypothetical protein